MTDRDPDDDLLKKLDQKARIADMLAAAKALLFAGIASGIFYRAVPGLGGSAEVARDGAIVILVGGSIWLFRMFDPTR